MRFSIYAVFPRKQKTHKRMRECTLYITTLRGYENSKHPDYLSMIFWIFETKNQVVQMHHLILLKWSPLHMVQVIHSHWFRIRT